MGAFRFLWLLVVFPGTDLRAAPVAVPERVDVVVIHVASEGDERKLVVTPTAGRLRVDVPDEGYSLIYDRATQFYTGLENRNYTYWQFSWPQVQAAVESTGRYQNRLREVGNESLSGNTPAAPDPTLPNGGVVAPVLDTNLASAATAPASTATAAAGSDDSGYVWHPTNEKKRIAGFECVKWTGDSVSNPAAEAWCYAGALPKVAAAMAGLREINEPVALVPVRSLVPPLAFVIDAALEKGGNTPLLMTWGDDQDKSRVEVLGVKNREGRADLFAVPKLYVKTTLVTMDGIGGQKPQAGAIPPNVPMAPKHLRSE